MKSAVSERNTKHIWCVGSLWGGATDASVVHDHMNFMTTRNEAQWIYPIISKVKQIIYLFEISVAAADRKMMWETTGVLWGPLSRCLLGTMVWSSRTLWVEALLQSGNRKLMESVISSRALQRRGVCRRLDTGPPSPKAQNSIELAIFPVSIPESWVTFLFSSALFNLLKRVTYYPIVYFLQYRLGNW